MAPVGAALAASDCERLRAGPVAQPANTASSAVLVLTGAAMAAWARRQHLERPDLAVGWSAALVAAGLGSIDYHGLQSPMAAWGHDAGVALPVLMALHIDAATVWPRLPPAAGWAATAAAALTAGVVLARAPAAVPAAAVVAATVFAATESAARRRRPSRRRRLVRAATAVAALGAVTHSLTRTGRPGCRPDSWLQGHAAWHLCSAAALAAWGTAALPAAGNVPAGHP